MSDTPPVLWIPGFNRPKTNLSAEVQPSSIRTAMESGTFRQRRRFTTDYTQVEVSWSLSDTEFGIFSAFCQYKLQQCSAWFNIELPLGGLGMVVHTARFVDATYKHDYDEVGYWIVSAKLEIQQVHRFAESTLDLYLYLGFTQAQLDGLLDLFDNVHHAVHHTYYEQTS